MAKGIVRIEGFRECREALQDLSKAVQRGVGRRALLAPAGVIVAAVRSRAPVSSRPGDPTPGSLRDSITVRPEKSSRRSVAQVAVVAEDDAAVPKEFGLARRDYPPEPFFRPAVDAARMAAAQAFAAALKPEVDAAVARAAKRAGKAK